MGMVLMGAGMGGCCLFRVCRFCVMHPMAVMSMVMVHFGQCDLRGQCRDRSQGKGKTSHFSEEYLVTLESSSLVFTLDSWFWARLNLSLRCG